MSAATIRALEGGQSNSSLGTVLVLVDALGLSLDRVVAQARAEPDPVAVVSRGGSDDADLSAGLADAVLSARIVRLGGGSLRGVPDEALRHPTLGAVFAGGVTATTADGARVRLAREDAYHAQPGRVTGWAGAGDDPALLLHVADTRHGDGEAAPAPRPGDDCR